MDNWTHSALLTDLYQLTMLDGYYREGMEAEAVFEFFVRRLPAQRNFLVAAGLEHVLDYLKTLYFSESDIRCLSRTERFGDLLLDKLRTFRFTGDVDAMQEGTFFFTNEPIIRVTAPLPEAQFIESRLINIVHCQTLIASKAVRYVLAAKNKQLIDFGMRRAHGAEAAMFAARASYLAGFDGTATVAASERFDIPVYGTMAHSFVQAHTSEAQAFEAFARANPGKCIVLIDTYDTEQGARIVCDIGARLRDEGIGIAGVRLDSGDLGDHAFKVRQILDMGGMTQTRIFASGGLDEHEIARLLSIDAPIDGFGVGTLLDTSADQPYLDCAYKLQEYAGRVCRKRSEGKATWPGRKQVVRRLSDDDKFDVDTVVLDNEAVDETILLRPVMRNGICLNPPEPLADIRRRVRDQLGALSPALIALDPAPPFNVQYSAALRQLVDNFDASES